MNMRVCILDWGDGDSGDRVTLAIERCRQIAQPDHPPNKSVQPSPQFGVNRYSRMVYKLLRFFPKLPFLKLFRRMFQLIVPENVEFYEEDIHYWLT